MSTIQPIPTEPLPGYPHTFDQACDNGYENNFYILDDTHQNNPTPEDLTSFNGYPTKMMAERTPLSKDFVFIPPAPVMEVTPNAPCSFGTIPSLHLPALVHNRPVSPTIAPINYPEVISPKANRRPLPPPITTDMSNTNYKWPTSFRQFFRDTLISPRDAELSPRSLAHRRNCSLAMISPSAMEVTSLEAFLRVQLNSPFRIPTSSQHNKHDKIS
jgi:hypothetical protein